MEDLLSAVDVLLTLGSIEGATLSGDGLVELAIFPLTEVAL
jgi:hypothetical protein